MPMYVTYMQYAYRMSNVKSFVLLLSPCIAWTK